MVITLATLPQASLQDIFNQVAIHLLTQNKKSQVTMLYKPTNKPEAYCVYRGPDNMCCAFGCLIADNEYIPEFEHKGVKTLYVNNPQLPQLSTRQLDFVAQLQNIHDHEDVSEWLSALKNLASEYNLTTKTLDDYLHHKNTSDSAGESERPTS